MSGMSAAVTVFPSVLVSRVHVLAPCVRTQNKSKPLSILCLVHSFTQKTRLDPAQQTNISSIELDTFETYLLLGFYLCHTMDPGNP